MEKEQLQQQLQTTLQAADIQAFVTLAKQAIETYPEEAFANYYFGEALIAGATPAYAQAEQFFNKALHLDTDNLSYWFKYAFAQEQQYEYEDAANTYRLILEKDPENAEAFLNLGLYYTRHDKKLDYALYYLGSLIAKSPDDMLLYAYRAEAFLNNEKYDEALADLEYALSEEFEETAAILLIQVLKKKDRATETYSIYEELIEQYPNNFAYAYDYATALFEAQEYEQAESFFARALPLMPKEYLQNSYVQRPIAETYLQVGKYQEAIAGFDICIAQSETPNKDLYVLSAQAKSGAKLYEAALADLEKAIEIASYNELLQTQILAVKSAVLLDMGKIEEAETNFKNLQKHQVFESEGDYGMALVEFKRSNFRISYQFALKALKQGHPKAKRFITKDLDAYLDKIRKNVFIKFAPEIPKNAQHPVLKQVIGKCWKFTGLKTPQVPNSDILSDEERAGLKKYFAPYSMVVSEKEIFLHAPYFGQPKDATRATVYAYKITGEKGNLVQLQLVSTDGETTLTLKLKMDSPTKIWIDKTDLIEELLQLEPVSLEVIPAAGRKAFQRLYLKDDCAEAAPTIQPIIQEMLF